MKPVTPSFTASAFPPTLVATTGSDAAMASTMALEKPSLREGRTKMSAVGQMFLQIGNAADKMEMIGEVQIPDEGLQFFEIVALQHIAGNAE